MPSRYHELAKTLGRWEAGPFLIRSLRFGRSEIDARSKGGVGVSLHFVIGASYLIGVAVSTPTHTEIAK